jgi:SAM-dependent methyltransferase
MADIFNGRVAGIDLAVKAEVLARVYADGPIHDVARKSLSSVVDILAHKNPTMRVLEVGAGTGSCTSIALDVLIVDDRDMPGHHAKRYHDYAFTDISPAFFEKAEELFGVYPPMDYKTFDLSVDAAEQGFELGEYDLILASNVMHAPGNTDRLLQNCSHLLKPGGKLEMLEITQTGSLTPYSLPSVRCPVSGNVLTERYRPGAGALPYSATMGAAAQNIWLHRFRHGFNRLSWAIGPGECHGCQQYQRAFEQQWGRY